MVLVAMLMMAGAATASPAADIITFRTADVLVVDGAGQPLFRSAGDYLLKAAGNPAGQVIRYDSAAQRVLVSKAGPEYWVRCADVAPMLSSCPAATPRPATRSIRIPRAAAQRGTPDPDLAARGLPACPGDPRCPKSD